jgi:formate dehydrogenase maturation protein FdhE
MTTQLRGKNDTYTPPRPDVAVCPECGAECPAVSLDTPGLRQAMLSIHCPACDLEWSEHRARGVYSRGWEARESFP